MALADRLAALLPRDAAALMEAHGARVTELRLRASQKPDFLVALGWLCPLAIHPAFQAFPSAAHPSHPEPAAA